MIVKTDGSFAALIRNNNQAVSVVVWMFVGQTIVTSQVAIW